ncbi:hypothetical protein LCGC14_3018140 [marine sediment metagenome]|uniref:Uncharacterized protein n=1 Tax=marine sediment metagenome TaxID=412755 RepID=A0A0F8ZM86_9ZZZZ
MASPNEATRRKNDRKRERVLRRRRGSGRSTGVTKEVK